MVNKMYAHLTYTWLLSLLFQSVIFLLFALFIFDEYVNIWGGLAFSFHTFVIGVFCSLPAVFVAMFFLRVILCSSLQRSFIAFLIWCITIWVSILFFPATISLLFIGELHIHELGLLLPALIGATVTLIVRYRQFEDLFYLYKKNEISIQ